MPSLRELQAGFAAGVVSGDFAEALIRQVVDDAAGAAGRLGIYHNHYRISLTETLESTFPVVRRLVGAGFFAMAAGRFIQAHPPQVPCLAEYGGAFPPFLERMEEARPLVYLGDVARLEWALNEAYFARDADPACARTLAQIPLERLLEGTLPLHPACRIVASPWPIDRIWQANRTDDGPEEIIDLNGGGARLLVHRSADGEVGWRALSPGGLAFVEALTRGCSLGVAAATHAAAADDTELTPLLAALIEDGVFLPPVDQQIKPEETLE
jgi:hypothetical protein